MKHVLVLAPHPDDESIGCGGTLRLHANEGHFIHLVVLTSGEKGGHGRDPATTRDLREAEARQAANVLGIQRIDFWREPDGALRAGPQLAERLAAVLRESAPDYIYLPHEEDGHPDHHATVQLLRLAWPLALAAERQPEVRCYEVWTPIQRMAAIVDISPCVESKRAAIRAHASQCEVLDFEAAALGLNRYRGEMHSWPGGDYAEVFGAFRP